MLTFTATIAFYVVLLWLSWRVEKLIRDYWAFAKKHIEPALSPRAETETDEPIPSDLMHAAMGESEGWARESTLRAIRDLYNRTHNWDVVRQQIMSAFAPLPDELH